MIKRIIIALFAVTISLGSLSACGNEADNEYTEVCVDQSGNRVYDDLCGSQHSMYPGVYWMYYPMYTIIPAYGYVIPYGGYRTLPRRAHLSTQRPPSAGGQIQPTTSAQKKVAQKQVRAQQKAEKAQAKKFERDRQKQAQKTQQQQKPAQGGQYKPVPPQNKQGYKAPSQPKPKSYSQPKSKTYR